jgi:hypothetical protein
MGGLVLGTDHLGAMATTKRLSGVDFYMGVKINAFTSKFKKRSISLGRSNRKWDKVGCFKF